MRSFLSILLLPTALSLSTSLGFASNIEIIQPLQKYEIHESSMILSGDYLYFGEAKFAQTDSHKLFIYKRSSAKIVKTILLKHSVQYLAKTGNDGVFLTGKTSNPWLSYITQVTPQGSDFQVSTELVRGQQLMEHIANDTQGTLYFSDPGSRTVFKGARSGPSKFMDGISNPGALVVKNNSLFVIERNSKEAGDENVLKIDRRTKQISSLYPRNKPRGGGMDHLGYIDEAGLLAVNQWGTNRVTLINTENMTVSKEMFMDGVPESIDTIGRCLVVAASGSQTLHVVSYLTDESRTFDFSSEPIRLKSVRMIQASPFSNGAEVFLRSTMVCDSGCQDQTYSSVAKLTLTKSDLGHCFE